LLLAANASVDASVAQTNATGDLSSCSYNRHMAGLADAAAAAPATDTSEERSGSEQHMLVLQQRRSRDGPVRASAVPVAPPAVALVKAAPPQPAGAASGSGAAVWLELGSIARGSSTGPAGQSALAALPSEPLQPAAAEAPGVHGQCAPQERRLAPLAAAATQLGPVVGQAPLPTGAFGSDDTCQITRGRPGSECGSGRASAAVREPAGTLAASAMEPRVTLGLGLSRAAADAVREVQRLIAELAPAAGPDQLTILEPIGQGGYGVVYRGTVRVAFSLSL
jgi:hypothetical protein